MEQDGGGAGKHLFRFRCHPRVRRMNCCCIFRRLRGQTCFPPTSNVSPAPAAARSSLTQPDISPFPPSGARTVDASYKLSKSIKIAMLYLEDDDSVSAEMFIKKASSLIGSCKV